MFRYFIAFCLTFLLIPAFANDYVIHAGRFVDVIDGSVQEDISIIVEGNKIKEVESGLIATSGNQQLIDLSEYTVMPGLMDLHTHITGQLSPQRYTERFFMNQADIALRSTVYAERTLMSGFTTVRDLGDSEPGVSTSLRDAINKGYVKGPRIYAAGKSIATTGGHADPTNGLRAELKGDPGPKEGVINGPDDARKAVRQRYKDGSDVIKLTVTGGVLSLAKSGDNPQFTDEELAAIVATAKDYDFIVAVHAHGVVGMKRAIRAGVDSVEHGSYMDAEAMKLMKKHGTVFVPTLAAAFYIAQKAEIPGFLPEIVRPKARVVGKIVQEVFADAYKKGVKIVFGTDAGTFDHGLNAKEFELMHQAGMPTIETIQAATINAATFLRIADTLGSIEAGKIADIVAVKGDPLEDITLMMDVGFVMKEGTIYKNE